MAELEDKLNAILGDPQAMGQILSMARALSGGGEEPVPSDAPDRPDPPPEQEPVCPPESPGDLGGLLGDLDPELLQKGLTLLQAYRAGDDRREALLNALAPYLSPQRREKLEQARRIVRLTRVATQALGLFRTGGEEASHV